MPVYNDLRPKKDFKEKDYALVFPDWHEPDENRAEKKRTIENLLALRQGLQREIAVKKADNNLLVASWNIKEFGHTTQRLNESYHYIAEIIAAFDLVAVQEIKTGLKDLNIIMRLLGPDWTYLINDITEGTDGNNERSGFVFNKKRVNFAGLAGEIVLWDDLTRNSTVKQLKRTPYITGFNAGWKTFAMINLHLQPGESDANIKKRREEVTLLLKAIKQKISDGHFWNENLILCGDFNFYAGAAKDDPTIKAIHEAGFKEVESLIGKDTNASETEAYDRLFLSANEYFTLGKNSAGKENGGVFNPFDYVFKFGREEIYKDYMIDDYTGEKDMTDAGNRKSYFKHPWRKNQITDHFPIWFELVIDSSDTFLTEKKGEM